MINEAKLCLIKMPEGHTDANGSVCIDAIKYYVSKYFILLQYRNMQCIYCK